MLSLNPSIYPPYSGRTTGFASLVLAECNFGISLTWTSEEGLPLFKEEVVEYFSPVVVVFLEELLVCKNGKAFCIRVFHDLKKCKKI